MVSTTCSRAAFKAEIAVTQMLEVPFHIPNVYLKIKYRYRNRIYRYKSNILSISGSNDIITNTQDPRLAKRGEFYYNIPIPEILELDIHKKSNVLESLLIHCKIRSNNKKKGLQKIGEVIINLSEFANDKEITCRRYLLHKCKLNALLCVSVVMKQVSGDKFFKCPSELNGHPRLSVSNSNDSDPDVKSIVQDSEQSFDYDRITGKVLSSSNQHHKSSSAQLIENLISESLHNRRRNLFNHSMEEIIDSDLNDLSNNEEVLPDFRMAFTPPLYDSLIQTIDGED